jgi:nitrite reductase/ring-hydroxylating ferredoxin subunit
MGILKRLLGVCDTKPPEDAGCWNYTDGKLEIILDRAPELSRPGGAIRLEGTPLPQRVMVMRGQEGNFFAFPNRCTHIGHRRLDPVPGEDKIRCCSVGKSVFDSSGKNISGSASTPLQPLQVKEDAGKLIVSVM